MKHKLSAEAECAQAGMSFGGETVHFCLRRWVETEKHAFNVSWLKGEDGKAKLRLVYHYSINFLLIAAWLLAVSNFPLTCWIRVGEPLSESETINVGLARAFALAGAQALAAAEIFKPDWIKKPAATPPPGDNGNGGGGVDDEVEV
jgi:hypothetical protein